MRLLFALLAVHSIGALNSQTDTVRPKVAKCDSSKSTTLRTNTDFVNVCRNDTMWLYDWQYDSTIYYRRKGLTMSVWGTGPTADTLIRVGKEDYHPSEFHGWLYHWMIGHWNCSYNYIYYNSGELHMTFVDYGEGHMGVFTEYHKNGKLMCKGMYCSANPGVKYGTWQWFDESGTLIRTKTFKGGKYCLQHDTKARRIYPFWQSNSVIANPKIEGENLIEHCAQRFIVQVAELTYAAEIISVDHECIPFHGADCVCFHVMLCKKIKHFLFVCFGNRDYSAAL
jgi:hypothetical protein